ncbi:MAG: fatty-acid synthase [Chloroflexaceae bacterium]|nr:fatty-acid synthase [Chloroflexaceae bacterium]
MPARDTYHHAVKQALLKDGWTITHDPLRLSWGRKDLYVDLGAERLVTAEKAGQKIAVEVKSFVGHSEIDALEKATGQYMIYQAVMSHVEPERGLYLAIPESVFTDLFEEPIGTLVLQHFHLQLIVFDPATEVIDQWIPTPQTPSTPTAS